MAQPIAPTNIEASLGDVSGQVAIGDYNVQIHAEHGAIVNFSGPEKQPRPSRRLSPQRLRPRPFYDLLDRKTEVESVISAVAAATPVQFHGPAGAGKTTLLRYLAYRAEVERLSDGVVYLSALNQPSEDLLQSLFDAFYECEQAFKPTDAQLRHYFANTQAAILLDDLDLTREQTGLLLNVAPGCAFVLASPVQSLWGEGRAIALGGLPAPDGLALIERELGRALTLDERDAAQTINSALDGQPLRIIRLVASALDQRRSLVETASKLQVESRDARVVPITVEVEAKSLEKLPDGERRALSVVAVFEGEPVRAQHVAALTGDSAIQTTLDSLVRRGLLQSADDRYALAGGLTETISGSLELASFGSGALAYFAKWAEEHRDDREELMKDTGAITQLMKWGAAAESWEEVKRLGLAVEGALTVSGRWGAWAQTLEYVLRGSEATANKADIAWAMHQLGTRALCLSDKSTARSYLTQALDMRQSMGDQIGAGVTQHNLDLLLGPPTVQEQREKPKRRRLTRRFLVPAALVLLGAFGIWSALPAPVPAVSPEKVEFREQVVSVSSEPRTVTLSNPHWRSAGISRVAIEGDNAEDFAITENDCSTSAIGAGRECTIKVAFTPKGTGDRAARLVIAAGAKGQSLTTVQLTGTGVPPPVSGVTVFPGSLSFPNQEIFVESEAQSVRITNVGPQPFKLGQASLIGTDAARFTITTDCDGSVILPQETCTIRVMFFPTAPGPQSATLVIKDASGEALHDVVLLTGVGQPVVTVPVASLGTRPPSPVDFGTLEIGSQSTPHQIEIINDGSAPLTISDIVIADGHTDEFSVKVKNCARATLRPGEACAIDVQFAPKTAGSHSASLRIEDKASHVSHSVLLHGSAVAATIRVDPPLLDFGSHQIGDKVDGVTFTVSNLGLAQLRIGSVVEGGAAAAFPMKTDCTGAVIPPNGRCSIGVSFATRIAGKFGASIIISSNAVNGTQTIPLNGDIQPPQARPEVKLSGDPLDFGAVEVGNSKKQKITVSNVGLAPLRIDNIGLNGGDADEFSFSTKCAKSPVAQNSGCTIDVTFSPKAPGPRSASLLISDNTQSGAESVRITGSGTSVDGWCCSGERVFQSSKTECQRKQGAFNKTEALAKLACQKTGVCCIDGEKSAMLESECHNRGGIFYSNLVEAMLKCKKKELENGWCCAHGEIFQTLNQQACQNSKGIFFKSKSEAKRQCKTIGNPVGAIQ